MDSEDLERERGITIHAKNTAIRLRGRPHPPRRHARPRRLRRRGRARARHGRRGAAAGLRRRGRDAADALRAAQGARARPAPDPRRQQDRPRRSSAPPKCSTRSSTCSSTSAPTTRSSTSRWSTPRPRRRRASREADAPRTDLRPLLDTILEFVAAADRGHRGTAPVPGHDARLRRLRRPPRDRPRRARPPAPRRHRRARARARACRSRFRVTKLFGAYGLDRREIEEALAGDLVVIAGVDSIDIGDTICDPGHLERCRASRSTRRPCACASRSTTRRSRAARASSSPRARSASACAARRSATSRSGSSRPRAPTSSRSPGRGEMQIGVLIETMRREGYEFSVSRPEIILREVDGKSCEPVEDVVAEVPETAAGLGDGEALAAPRRACVAMEQRSGTTILQFVVPSRGLFGYRSEFLSDTRGEGILHRTVRDYEPCSRRSADAQRRRDRGHRAGRHHRRTRCGRSRSAAISSSGPGVALLRGPDRRPEPPRRTT